MTSLIDENPKQHIRRLNDLIESLIESNFQKATQIGDMNRALFAANEEVRRLDRPSNCGVGNSNA
jgi:hypothetical protein